MAEDKKRKSWQVPAYSIHGGNKSEVHAWMIQNVEDGMEFQQASPGYQQLEESIRILTGEASNDLKDKQKKGYSKLQVNHLKRNITEMVNALSEIRYNPGYRGARKDTIPTANVLNDFAYSWYLDQFADLKIKKAVQWAAICPCGWLEPCYRRFPGDHGRADIDLIPHSFFDVVMTGVPESGDHQEAYTVTIIKDLPVFMAHSMFPDNTRELQPDRDTPKTWMDRIKEKAATVIRDVFSTEPEKSTAKNPTCRLYYQYVLDLAVNRSGKTMYMGYEKKQVRNPVTQAMETKMFETPWSYTVPSIGEMVLRGYQKKEGQLEPEPIYAMATVEEARIFPGRRLIIGNKDVVLYDGPMFDWHGKVPLIKFVANQWVFGDFSMIHDVVSIHDTINEIDRVTHQTVRNRFDPTLLMNTKAITRPDQKRIRSDIQGDRIGYNGGEAADPSKAVAPLFTPSFNTIEPWIKEFQTRLTSEEDYITGRPNFAALAKMKVSVSDDATEKILQDAGPIVKGISRDMERSMRDFADMFKYYVFQYKTTPELIWAVGDDAMTPANFDYDPGNMIPSHLPHEFRDKPSIYSKMQRARWAAEHVKFLLLPGTMHEIVQTQQKLVYMQLWAKGFPIDPVTLGEVLRLGNVGQLDGSTMIERYFNWKKKEMEMMIAIKKEAQELLGEDAPQPENDKLGPKGGQKKTGGRPGSASAPPQVKTKGDGRVVSTESK